MNNPYHAPEADLSGAAASDQTYEPAMFAVDGRIGRLRLAAYSFALTAALLLMAALLFSLMIGVPAGMGLLRSLGFVPVLAVMFAMAIRRLNDLDRAGWWSLLLLVPFVNLAAGVWLLCAPGSRGENNYGPAPAANSVPVVAGAVAAALCAFVIAGSTAFTIYTLSQANAFRIAPAAQRR